MLGNEEDARFIRDWYLNAVNEKGDRWNLTPPEGWARLGGGCYRAAFLHEESGVVYKVQHSYGYGYGQSNASEAETLRRYMFRKLPQGCRFPRYSFYELDGKGVMAMERFSKLLRDYSRYAEGSHYWDRLRKLQGALYDVYDLHSANLAIDEENQLLVPIDLGG